jgi:hypothetical protein
MLPLCCCARDGGAGTVSRSALGEKIFDALLLVDLRSRLRMSGNRAEEEKESCKQRRVR